MSSVGPRESGPRRLRACAAACAAYLALAPPVLAENAVSADEERAVTLVRPLNGALVSTGRTGEVTLTWSAPARAGPYFVEVVALGQDAAREVFAGYTQNGRLRVSLPSAGTYAWRILAVRREGAHYTVSSWRSFTVAADARR